MTQFTDAELAQYLLDNPGFFEEHADVFAGIRLASPSTGKAVSLHERQIEVLRKRQKDLERDLARLVAVAQDNRELMEKTIDLAVRLLGKPLNAEMPEHLIRELKSVFSLKYATLRLWDTKEEYAGSWFTQDVTEGIRGAVGRMEAPYCGIARKAGDILAWFENPDDIQSAALTPLAVRPTGRVFGLLAIGSPDPDRFLSGMGTDFLTAIGKTAGAALSGLAK